VRDREEKKRVSLQGETAPAWIELQGRSIEREERRRRRGVAGEDRSRGKIEERRPGRGRRREF
jgi:hypothetical protein